MEKVSILREPTKSKRLIGLPLKNCIFVLMHFLIVVLVKTTDDYQVLTLTQA